MHSALVSLRSYCPNAGINSTSQKPLKSNSQPCPASHPSDLASSAFGAPFTTGIVRAFALYNEPRPSSRPSPTDFESQQASAAPARSRPLRTHPVGLGTNGSFCTQPGNRRDGWNAQRRVRIFEEGIFPRPILTWTDTYRPATSTNLPSLYREAITRTRRFLALRLLLPHGDTFSPGF